MPRITNAWKLKPLRGLLVALIYQQDIVPVIFRKYEEKKKFRKDERVC